MEIADLEHVTRVHFTGVKGIAMAALASYFADKGVIVTGSDVAGQFPSDDVVAKAGITVSEGFSKQHIKDSHPDVVIYTGAHQGIKNPEVDAARQSDIPCIPHGKALGLCMQSQKRISIAGCHGKTTTSAMVSTVMSLSGKKPSYAVGCGWIFPIGNPGHADSGTWFIAEADEYVTDPTHDLTPRFMWQHPDICCITNIDFDHPDVYRSMTDIVHAYQRLVSDMKSDGYLVINGDDKNCISLVGKMKKILVGRSAHCDYRIVNEKLLPRQTTFDLIFPDQTLMTIHLSIPGAHNIANAAQSVVVTYLAGCTCDEIKDALLQFKGTKRRFERIGQLDGITFYDDYAHHPQEISATIKATKGWFPDNRIIVVFEPHTYSRTKALLQEFGEALSLADISVVTDIYASARENDTLGISATDVVHAVQVHGSTSEYRKDADDVTQFLKQTLTSGDVVLFMGAGDIYRWSRSVIKRFTT